jgi:hypothetical protein
LILSTLLLRSSDIRPIVWCVIGLCAGIYLFFQGFRLLQRRRLILDTPVSKIRSASLGMVELNGLATGPYTTIAPITSRPCFYYRTLVWEWKRRGRSRQWVKVAAECMHVPFFIDDDTAQVLVDPRGADLDLHRDFKEEFCDSFFTTKPEVPPNVNAFLSRHGIVTSNKIKVEEFCIKPKNALFLLGTLGENPGLQLTSQPFQDDDAASVGAWDSTLSPGGTLGRGALSFLNGGFSGLGGFSMSGGLQHDPAYDPIYDKAISSPSSRVIRLSPDAASATATGMTQQQKIAAALMKAGISNPAAWQAAGSGTSGAANPDNPNTPTASDPLGAFDPHPAVVLMKGKNNSTFLISWRSQRDLARSLGWKCALMIWGGPALSLLCLYGLLALTHHL